MSVIKAGDLVQIVRECSSRAGGVGLVFRVSALYRERLPRCALCGGDHTGLFAQAEQPYGDRFDSAPVSWLIKIDPPKESDTVTRETEVEHG